MTGKQFAEKCKRVATECKTLYVMGGWGQPLTTLNKVYFKTAYSFNRGESRAKAINSASADTFAFDCVCFVKSMIDGFAGNPKATRGGAAYGKPCPDITIQALFDECYGKSADLSTIVEGELIVSKDYGHCGIYVGDGMVCECTYTGRDGVQLIPMDAENRKDMWKYHGKLAKYMDYNVPTPAPAPAKVDTKALKDMANTLVCVKKGMQGTYVKELQKVLIAKGYSCGGTGADGDFGKNTEKAVLTFQQDNKLYATGIVDFDTLSCLIGK